MKKKLPLVLTTEELLELAENTDKTDEPVNVNEHPIFEFLANLSIYPGTNEIKSSILFKIYKQWSDDPVIGREFHVILQGYLPYKDGIYFLNRNAKDLAVQLSNFIQKKRETKKKLKKFHYKHFEQFVEYHCLTKGNINISAGALYFFYDKWQYNRKYKTRLSFGKFVGILKMYFETKRTARVWCVVKINQEFIDKQTQEKVNTAIEWGKKFNGKVE